MKKIILLLVLSFSLVFSVTQATAYDECELPPFVGTTLTPNVLIAFDNSGSMYDLAYDTDGRFCIDESYQDSNSYYGYFEQVTKVGDNAYEDVIYEYNNETNIFKVSDVSLPKSGCINSDETQGIFCVNPSTNEYYFKGKFLNWLTMSKLDLVKKALTGGKYMTEDVDECDRLLETTWTITSDTLRGESRGCVGRRFLKQIPNSGVSFAIRGTKAIGDNEDACTESDESDYGELYIGGTTKIEIFNKTIDFEKCQELIDALEDPKLGDFKQKTEDCIFGLEGAQKDSLKSNSIAAFNHAMQTCFTMGDDPANPIVSNGDISRSKEQCEKVYKDLSNNWSAPIDWSKLTHGHAAYVCTKRDDLQTPGYVGQCFNQAVGDKNNNSWTSDECVKQQLINYCQIMSTPEVIDPSEELQDTGKYANIPAMITDSAVLGQAGDPVATLQSVVEQDQEPEGVLHRIRDKVQLGLIAVNDYGSKFEMDPTKSDSYYGDNNTKDRDGGEVLSAVEASNSTIIKAFNDLEAYPWTPIGELFYEAARYFAGRESAYNENTTYTTPIKFWCQKNAVVFLSDGGSTFDQNVPGSSLPSSKRYGTLVTDASFDVQDYLTGDEKAINFPYGGSYYAKGVAYWAHTKDLITGDDNMPGKQVLDFYTVFTLGSSQGDNLLKDIAKYGGYRERDGTPGPTHYEEYSAAEGADPHNYFSVSNPAQLGSELEKVFANILESTGSAGAVATVTQQVEGEDIVVRGAFTTYENNDMENLVWKGHLEAYWPYEQCSEYMTQASCEVDPDCRWEDKYCVGLYSFQKDTNRGKFCSEMDTGSRNCWEAEEHLPDPNDRTIFTVLPDPSTRKLRKVDFVSTDTRICPNNPAVDNYDLLGLKSDPSSHFNTNDCANLVNWIRGTEGWEKARNRDDWILGDIVYSTPVIVGPPSLSSLPPALGREGCINELNEIYQCDELCTDLSREPCEAAKKCYYCYVERNRYRKKMIYVGGNDGMLHAFVAAVWDGDKWVHNPAATGGSDIGKEVWAYIPSNLLSELKELARPTYGQLSGCRHRTMVDLSPRVYDVFINVDTNGDGTPDGPQWRTVLLGGERGGGDVYFAIDVTDPDNPNVLWEYSVLRNMVQLQENQDWASPYLDIETYKKVKNLPFSFSVPAVGRLRTKDTNLTFRAAKSVFPLLLDPDPIAPLTNAQEWAGSELSEWFVFAGGGARIFDPDDLEIDGNEHKTITLKPYLVAIDIETGVNIFQRLWPQLQHYVATANRWNSIPTNSHNNITNTIPYSISSPTVVDIWNSYGALVQDGYADHMYFGDLNGQFYSVKFDLDTENNKGMKIDVYPTKPITEATPTNIFRSNRQPIAVMPVAALDPKKQLHVYLGTGKFENLFYDINDRTDQARMSFYSFQDLPKNNVFPLAANIADGNFGIQIDFHFDATNPSFNNDCTWVRDDGKPDCCELTCGNACWYSVYDFTRDGERVVGPALVAGELVFFTTFVPLPDPCGAIIGDAYLYVMDYLARPLTRNPLQGAGLAYDVIYSSDTDDKQVAAYSAHLGTGMPSEPVLDSSGNYVLVQTSDAEIHKIRVDLLIKPFYYKGWKEKE